MWKRDCCKGRNNNSCQGVCCIEEGIRDIREGIRDINEGLDDICKNKL